MKALLNHSRSWVATSALALCAVNAMASPVVINTGSDFNLEPNGSTKTATFASLGYDGTLNTNIYLGNPKQKGTTVVMTNIPSIMNFYGFSAGSKPTINGGSVSLNYPQSPAENNVDTLNNPSVGELNGFSGGIAFPQYGAGAIGGIGGAWGLTYAYQFIGTTVDTNGDSDADAIEYTGGVLSLLYQSAAIDPNNGKEVLRLIVDSGSGGKITGHLDFSYAGSDAFIQNFFIDALSDKTFYSLWDESPTSPSWDMDWQATLDGNDKLWNSGSALIAQTSIDGALTLTPRTGTLPEPGSLLLAGLALAGLGVARRRRPG